MPAPQDFRFNLEVWFDGRCPSTVGFLHSEAAPQTVSVQPSGPKVMVGPETTIPTPHALPFGATYLLDNHKGLVSFWHETDSILGSRLDLNNPAAGFSNPPQKIVTGADLQSSVSAAVKPEGSLILMYASTRFVISNHSFEMVVETEINYKEGTFEQLASAPPHNVIKTDEPLLGLPFVIHYKDIVDTYTAFFYQRRGDWNVELLDVDFISGNVTSTLTGLPLRGSRLHAAHSLVTGLEIAVNSTASGPGGGTNDNGLAHLTFLPYNKSTTQLLSLSQKDCGAPFVLWHQFSSPSGGQQTEENCIFYRELGGSLYCYRNALPVSSKKYEIPQSVSQEDRFLAVADTESGLWAFWEDSRGGENHIKFSRYDRARDVWSLPQALVSEGRNGLALVRQTAPNILQAFYLRTVDVGGVTKTEMRTRTLTLVA